MSILKYFRPVATMTAEEVRVFLKDKSPEEYTLIDVRQPKEYERGHLPGARLIPVGEIPDRVNEIPSDRPAITYCASGLRSRAAAAVLTKERSEETYSMEGGIKAWEGLVAKGTPEAGAAYLAAAGGPEELIALAWMLEDGSRKFYLALSRMLLDNEAVTLFQDLSVSEEHHTSSLFNLYKTISRKEPDPDFFRSLIPGETPGDIIEGGMRLHEALQWSEGQDLRGILELALSLETNSYDLYLTMRRSMTDVPSKQIFAVLSAEEKTHLGRLATLLEKKL